MSCIESVDYHPLVSIALACFNGEKYLGEQLESILQQDYSNLEIVISDDGSTDSTLKIIESFAMKDSRIRLLPNDGHRGYVKNFMRAFKACRGTLISSSDQDDIWYPEKTSRLVYSMGDSSLIYCDSQLVNANGEKLGQTFSDTTSMLSGHDARSLLFRNSICGHAMIFRAELLNHIGNFEMICYVDWLLAFVAMQNGGVKYLDEPLVDWRQHEDSATFDFRTKGKYLKRKLMENDVRMLEAFSMIEGEHQNFIESAFISMKKWRESYFFNSMFLFVLKNSRITHKGHPARIPALKYLLGYKLKKMIRPNYY